MTPQDVRRARETERGRLTRQRMDIDRRLQYGRLDRATRSRLAEQVRQLDRQVAEIDGITSDEADLPAGARRRENGWQSDA